MPQVFKAKLEIQKSNFISSASYGIFIDLFLKLRSNNESFNNIVRHRARDQYSIWSYY